MAAQADPVIHTEVSTVFEQQEKGGKKRKYAALNKFGTKQFAAFGLNLRSISLTKDGKSFDFPFEFDENRKETLLRDAYFEDWFPQVELSYYQKDWTQHPRVEASVWFLSTELDEQLYLTIKIAGISGWVGTNFREKFENEPWFKGVQSGKLNKIRVKRPKEVKRLVDWFIFRTHDLMWPTSVAQAYLAVHPDIPTGEYEIVLSTESPTEVSTQEGTDKPFSRAQIVEALELNGQDPVKAANWLTDLLRRRRRRQPSLPEAEGEE